MINEVDSIFQQPWWLDAVAPNQWEEIIVKREGAIAARMPYVIKKRYGLTAISMPPLTPTLGPWLRPSKAKSYKKISEQKEFMNELMAQLPKVDYFCQSFSPNINNWLPFYWAGFQQTTRYTYRIESLSDCEQIWADMSPTTRNSIRKAEKQVIIRNDLGIDKLFEIISLTFTRQKMKVPYGNDFVKKLDNACAAQNARKMFFAEDGRGRIHAIGYIVWDSNTSYLLLGGGDPELRNSQAYSLLVWNAIKFSSTVAKVFDFEGSIIEPIEHFCRSFGAIQTPYFVISKMFTRRMNIAYHGREIIRAIANI
ncbi:MAG: GNAT family N-acetyltransferase [Syntrophomonadaceae bacterium]|nr:GNAT family N-acetyltransferase [Syntrophomonadaceae bacterium]